MELTKENYPEAFCEDCGDLLPAPEREDLGEGYYQLVTNCPCGAEYIDSL